MPNNIHIEADDAEQFDKMTQSKNRYGLTWTGLLVQGMKRVAAGDL